VFGGIAAGFFWLRERNAKLEAELQARELARLEAEKQSLAAQLRLLQAQIEPHFLFNSLANVAALIEADPTLAGRLLDALIRYLRASLQRTRAERGSLGDEVALLTAYLDVLKIRMGERLSMPSIFRRSFWREFPPMLLQPLVENAIRHGLEPKLGGGRCVSWRRSRTGHAPARQR
jgi:sensor histidine kinase YesM